MKAKVNLYNVIFSGDGKGKRYTGQVKAHLKMCLIAKCSHRKRGRGVGSTYLR